MYFTPSVSPAPAAAEEAADNNLPWLLIYGFIVILVLFFVYSTVRYIMFWFWDPPAASSSVEYESDTSSEFSDGAQQSNIEDTATAEQPNASQTTFSSTVSRLEDFLLSVLSWFFQKKKQSKETSVWYTGADFV